MSEADNAFIGDRLRELRQQYEDLTFVLPAGVIHGDANVGNVILSRDGKPVLIDLDSFCVGPREWDLVQTALFYERFGWHTEDEYRTFVDVYGFDIMEWPGYPVLAGYREISMTLWLAGKAENDEAVRSRGPQASRGHQDRWEPPGLGTVLASFGVHSRRAAACSTNALATGLSPTLASRARNSST